MKRTLALRDLTQEALLLGALLYPEAVARPRTFGECRDRPGPCPFSGCRHHLGLDVRPNGNLQPNPAGAGRCSLRLAEEGGLTADAVGFVLGLTKERVLQVERAALAKLGRAMAGWSSTRPWPRPASPPPAAWPEGAGPRRSGRRGP